MKEKKHSVIKSIIKGMTILGVGIAFYKLPTYVADKWMYFKIKTKDYSQKTEEENNV